MYKSGNKGIKIGLFTEKKYDNIFMIKLSKSKQLHERGIYEPTNDDEE